MDTFQKVFLNFLALMLLSDNLHCSIRLYCVRIRYIRSGDQLVNIMTVIAQVIQTGASLTGTTVSALRDPEFSISASGSIENYSRWPLYHVGCNIENGKMNVPMTSVLPGQKEGFASHKTGDAAVGNFIKCTYIITGNTSLPYSSVYIHIMYEIPYDLLYNANILSLAVCNVVEDGNKCWTLSAGDMRDRNYAFMNRMVYKDLVSRILICRSGICLYGMMGSSHITEITITLYPESFEDLSPTILSNGKFPEKKKAKSEYLKFIEDEKKIILDYETCGSTSDLLMPLLTVELLGFCLLTLLTM